MVEIHPLTSDRWPDLERLFGPSGADGGCWCMWWHQTRSEWDEKRGDTNRELFKAQVQTGPRPPGVLAYRDGEPVGWCAIAPRVEYERLARARTLKPVDDRPAWSVTCFYIARSARGQGIATALLEGAVEFARSHGAELVEGYPNDPEPGSPWADGNAYTGRTPTYQRCGFTPAPRTEGQRTTMRRELQ